MEPFRLGKEEKKIHWKLPVFLALAGAVLIGIFYVVLYADVVRLKELQIEGNRSLPRTIVMPLLESEIIQKDKWRALFGSDNIFFWLNVSQQEILERLPMLANLRIDVDVLERKVAILVTERKLRGIWCLPDVSCFIFDEAGIAFMEAPAVEGALILKITDENSRLLRLGQPVLAEPVWFRNLMAIIGDLDSVGLKIAAVRIKDTASREWQAELWGGPVLYFNFDARPAEFRSVISGLREELDFKKTGYIDFRVPNKVYYK